MSFSAKNYDFKGETCIELIAGDFRALIAPFNGSNVMKLENTALNIDILRNDLSLSPEELKAAAEVYGMPTLYLPNRLSHENLRCHVSFSLQRSAGQPSAWFSSQTLPYN